MARRTRQKSPGKSPGGSLPRLPELPQVVRDAMLTFQPEPELIAETIREILARRGKVSDIKACTRAYGDFHGLTPEQSLSPDHVVGMGALFLRVVALGEVMGSGLLDPGVEREGRFPALVEAASTVRLLNGKGLPCFQPLEFLAAVERIEAELLR